MVKPTSFREQAAFYLVDTTATLAESNPLYSAFEVGIAGMSDEVSINARLVATVISYGGLARAFTASRDYSRPFFGVTDDSPEEVQLTHDMLFTGAFNVALAPCMYWIAGARDTKEILVGTAVATVIGLANGSAMLYAADVFRDLAGLKSCERKLYPSWIRSQSPPMKKALAAGCIAASVGIMSLIYAATDNEPPVTLEQIVQQ